MATIFYVCVSATGNSNASKVIVRPELFITLGTSIFIILTRLLSNLKEDINLQQEPKSTQDASACVDANCHSRRHSRNARKRENAAVNVQAFFELLHRRLAVLKSSEVDIIERGAAHSQCLDAAEAMLFSLQDDMEKPNSKVYLSAERERDQNSDSASFLDD
jgi:beta-phosphoglucomutase-like phosphatase (HAD superfamily)